MDDATARPAFLCPMDGAPLRSASLRVNEPSWYVHEDGACHPDATAYLFAPTPEEKP